MSYGLIFGLIGGLGSGLFGGFTDRVKVDKTSPNQGINLSRKSSLATFLVTWLIGDLIFGLSSEAVHPGPGSMLYWWLSSWMQPGLFSKLYYPLSYWLISWLPQPGPEYYQRTTLSFVLADALMDGLILGLIVGLILGLNRGGSTVIKHHALRLTLWMKGYTPI